MRVFLTLFLIYSFADILCRDASGSVKWFSGSSCPRGQRSVNMHKLRNFDLKTPFPFAFFSAETNANIPASGESYFAVFHNSTPASAPSNGTMFNVFKCKTFQVYLEYSANPGCLSGHQRVFMLWDPSANGGVGAQIGTGQVALSGGSSGQFTSVAESTPLLVVFKSQTEGNPCAGSARWAVYCK